MLKSLKFVCTIKLSEHAQKFKVCLHHKGTTRGRRDRWILHSKKNKHMISIFAKEWSNLIINSAGRHIGSKPSVYQLPDYTPIRV